MTERIYRTAQGKMIDMGALALKNETTRAVGNMKTNARGDKIDSNGDVIVSRNQQSSKNYNQGVTTNVSAGPIPTGPTPVKKTSATPPPVDTTEIQAPQSGLAAAMARAKNNKE